MKTCVPRLVYIVLRLVEMIGSVISRLFNALVLNKFFGFPDNGSTHQTTSARMHIENWPRGKAFINVFFFWQEDHCQWAWEQEVKEALRTLEKSRGL